MVDDTQGTLEGEGGPGRSWQAFPSGLRLELVYAIPPANRRYEDLAEPFVPLGERGHFSRTLAARVTRPDGDTVREVALKIQSDEYPIASLPDWSNDDVDAQWDEQYSLVRRAAAHGAAPEVIDALPTPEDGPLQLPPTLFCKLRRAFFAAPCPQCGNRLHVCRDNALLEATGLPRYDRTLERFLYCSSCSGTPQHRFYSLILADPTLRQRAAVGEQTDLFSSFAKLAREGGALPCFGCANVPTCYPNGGSGDALRYLTPLSFYDFRCLTTERLDLHYDQFIAMLGGHRGNVRSVPEPGSHRTREFFFESDVRGRLPLEILRLKVLAFAQVVAAVSALYRATQRPHLSLSPDNIMVRIGRSGYGLPALYRFDVRLLGIGTTLRRKFEGLDDAALSVPVVSAPPFRDQTFAASLLAASATAHEGALSIVALSTAEGGAPIIEGTLQSDAFDVTTLTDKDALHISVRQGRPLPLTMELLTNPTRIQAPTAHLRSASVRADASQMRQLEALVGQGPVRAAFVVHPCLHVPCDLESLGILLATTLAANAKQGPAEVGKSMRGLSQRLLVFCQGHLDAGEDETVRLAHEIVQQADGEGSLAVRQLFHDPARFPQEAAASVVGYWRAALVLALRALTRVPGFGFCRAHDDFDPAHPEGPADHLLSELDILGQSMDEQLLLMQGRRREISEAIKRVRQRLASGGTGQSRS